MGGVEHVATGSEGGGEPSSHHRAAQGLQEAASHRRHTQDEQGRQDHQTALQGRHCG